MASPFTGGALAFLEKNHDPRPGAAPKVDTQRRGICGDMEKYMDGMMRRRTEFFEGQK